MGKTILITGADGYLGWYVCTKFLKKGNIDKIICVDNYSKRFLLMKSNCEVFIKSEDLIKKIDVMNHKSKKYNITFEYGDLKDSDFIKNILIKHSPDLIIHLAQQSSAVFSTKNIETIKATHDDNVSVILNLLINIKEFVPKATLIKIGTLNDLFSSFFSVTKYVENLYCQFFSKEYNLDITNINFGILYGMKVNDVTKKFYSRLSCDNVFGTIVNRILGQTVTNETVFIYGDENKKIPIIHINDAVNAIYNLSKRKRKKRSFFKEEDVFAELIAIKEILDCVENVVQNKNFSFMIKHITRSKYNKTSYSENLIEDEEQNFIKFSEVVSFEIQNMLQYRQEVML